jgi:hypothetical protein
MPRPAIFAALQFEQSVLVLDGEGGDQNAVANRNRYACEKQPIAAQTAADLVRDAVTAEGGAQALRGLTGLSVKGNARFWEPGQSAEPGGEARFLGTASFTTTWDLAGGRARTEWDRDQQYPPPAAKLKYTETLSPATGFVTDGNGNQPMSGVRIAAQLRELERTSPRLLLKAMDNIANVRAVELQQLGSVRCLRFPSPMAERISSCCSIRRRICPPPSARATTTIMSGDSNYDLVLSDWAQISGARVAKSLVVSDQRRRSSEAHL